jgi:hypothetical protein
MHEASEGEFYAALCAIAVVAMTLVLVAVGLIPSFGLFPKGPGKQAGGNVQGHTQGRRTTVFRRLSNPPPVPARV